MKAEKKIESIKKIGAVLAHYKLLHIYIYRQDVGITNAKIKHRERGKSACNA